MYFSKTLYPHSTSLQLTELLGLVGRVGVGVGVN